MAGTTRLALAYALAAAFTPCAAWAGHPLQLTDGQMDRVTAGTTVTGTVDADATGVLAITQTGSRSLAGQSAPPTWGQPGLASTVGFSSGVAVAVGTNLGQSDQPPPSASTSLVTDGSAAGRYVFKATMNQGLAGAGGVAFQAGFTFIYAYSGL